MADPSKVSSPSHLPSDSTTASKPVVVRVRRRSSQARLDAFWLDINERPAKRSFLDIEALSISDSSEKEEPKRRKLLVQHVETISNSEAAKDVLQSFLPDIGGSKAFQKKIEERRSMLNPNKKQEQLRSTARQKHEVHVRNARFQQIWHSRRGKDTDDEFLHDVCHLYDVVRVDTLEENSKKSQKTQTECSHVSFEDNAILCNYLPLMREFIPSAAEEIESDILSSLSKKDNYVYDLYTVEDGFSENEENLSAEYPLVQVDDEDDYYDGPDLDYETDDSNAEDNPNNDYPEEESSSADEGREEMDLYDEDVHRSQYEYEDEVIYVSEEEEEENRRWGYR